MKKTIEFSIIWVLLAVGTQNFNLVDAKFEDLELIKNYTTNLVQAKHVVLCACHLKDFLKTVRGLQEEKQSLIVLNINGKYSLKNVLRPQVHAKTAIVVDVSCEQSTSLVKEASVGAYLNKTYQWLLWDSTNVGIDNLISSDLPYLGPNAQITYINRSQTNVTYQVWDVHSKGLHLKAPLEISLLGEKSLSTNAVLMLNEDILNQQGIHKRNNFQGLTLRGASVIDQDNITENNQVEAILSRTTKDAGVSAFSKYHYEIMKIVCEFFNITVDYRNARGWAGRLGNTTFRLGYLGIMMRNEADIGASSIFNRINRFAEFDIIHQSWKFETSFLYRFTPDLDTHGKSGNFLAPFDYQVWFIALATLFTMNTVWRFVEYIKQRSIYSLQQQQHLNHNETSLSMLSLKTFGAICQQGLDPIPNGLASRIIILTTFLFSLVMYNYYTSSVVGGLLSSSAQGPSTVDEIVSSPLKLSFEDIGYYKVFFRENKTPNIVNLLNLKVIPPRDKYDLPVYAHINEAIPYMRNGTFAFHCEVVDAYPEIAKHFDVNQICELRVIPGIFSSELMNWIVTKNSVYTELFRLLTFKAREGGLVERLLHQRQPKKPKCQALYSVYPVSLSGVLSAFYIIYGAIILTMIVLYLERTLSKSVKFSRIRKI